MLPQFRWVTKGLSTLITHMGCFSSVNFSVINQGRVLLGGISTFWASKGSLFTVSYQVVKEREGLQEGFPTAAALEELL